MGRIDYYDDADAPAPDSLSAADSAVVTDSDESSALEFVDLASLDDLPIQPTQRLRLDHVLSGRSKREFRLVHVSFAPFAPPSQCPSMSPALEADL